MKQFPLIRLSQATYRALDEFRKRVERLHHLGRIDLPEGQVDHLSFGGAIDLLLERDNAHRARALKANAKRKEAKKGSKTRRERPEEAVFTCVFQDERGGREVARSPSAASEAV